MIEISRDWRGDAFAVLDISDVAQVNLDGTSAAATSSVLSSSGWCIARVAAIDDIRIAIGSSVEASATSTYMPAGSVEFFRVAEEHKVSVHGGQANITVIK